MEQFFDMEIEKYWDYPKNYKGNKQEEIKQFILSGNYLGSLKKDGHFFRYMNINKPVLLGRSRGVSGYFLDKIDNIPHIAKALEILPKGTVLLGEIHFNDINTSSSDITTIMGCKSEKAIERQTEGRFVHYYIFDILAYNNNSLLDSTFEERINILNTNIKPLFLSSKYIEVAEYCEGEELLNLLETALENGEEGIVMTLKNSKYAPKKRTKYKTIKVKKCLMNDIDVFFTGKYLEPTKMYTGKELEGWEYWENKKSGNKVNENKFYDFIKNGLWTPITKPYYHSWAGSLEIGCFKDGKIFPIGYLSGVSDAIKEKITQPNNDLILKPISVGAMQFTEDKKLRHPTLTCFREDLIPQDCDYYKIFGDD